MEYERELGLTSPPLPSGSTSFSFTGTLSTEPTDRNAVIALFRKMMVDNDFFPPFPSSDEEVSGALPPPPPPPLPFPQVSIPRESLFLLSPPCFFFL